MVDSENRTDTSTFPTAGDNRHMYYTRHQRLCRLACELCTSWATSGQRKIADYSIEYFPSEEKLSTENIKNYFCIVLSVLYMVHEYKKTRNWKNTLPRKIYDFLLRIHENKKHRSCSKNPTCDGMELMLCFCATSLR